MKTNLLMMLLAVIIGIGACKKGDTGPMGPQGEKGDQGIQGVTGVKGADGSTIFSGADVPTAAIGKNGDFYFRTATGVLYGPKTAAGWGDGTNLKGANGTNGTNGINGANGANGTNGVDGKDGKDGSQFISGTVIPDAGLGKIGDFYFNTAQMVLYGPKTATGWGVGANLKADARVMYSGWKTAVRVKDSTMDGTVARIAHIYTPQITETVMASAVVLMYIDYGGGPFPLPYTSRAGGRMSTIAFKLKKSEIVVYRYVYDGGALLMLGSQIQFRYVIIPGNMYIGLKERKIDFGNPAAVQQALETIDR